jgi:hypothetical protein
MKITIWKNQKERKLAFLRFETRLNPAMEKLFTNPAHNYLLCSVFRGSDPAGICKQRQNR